MEHAPRGHAPRGHAPQDLAPRGLAWAATPGAATRRVRLWLYGVAALIVIMVLVGGATRLTESGLSITEWKPITGTLPPLSHADWQGRVRPLQDHSPI